MVLTGGCQVGGGVLPIEEDHEVAVLLVGVFGLGGVPAVEEFWQRVSLYLVDAVQREPGRCLGGQVDGDRLRQGLQVALLLVVIGLGHRVGGQELRLLGWLQLSSGVLGSFLNLGA
jgi:hypothetical protein